VATIRTTSETSSLVTRHGPPRSHRLQIRLPPKLFRRLKALAVEEERSLSDLIVSRMEELVAERDRERRKPGS
jgi:hypothetical protein